MIIRTNTLERGEVTYAICDAVAEQINVDLCELPPLYKAIDPDALDAFLRCSSSTDTALEQSVEFSYCGYRVRIDSTGRLQLDPETEPTAIEDTKQLYAEDDILPKLETAMAESSAELKSDIQASINNRKKELRDMHRRSATDSG